LLLVVGVVFAVSQLFGFQVADSEDADKGDEEDAGQAEEVD
jgi:hypothetical protein